MARCRYCARSGWAVRTDDTGLCRSCRQVIQEEVETQLEHVRTALAYVRHAQDPEVQLSLCDVAIESVERLLPYEERRLAEITPLPSSLLMMLNTRKDEAAEQIVVLPSPMRQLHEGSVLLHQIEPPVAACPPEVAPSEALWWAWESSEHEEQLSHTTLGDEESADRRREGRIAVDCFALLLPGGTRATLENLSSSGVFLRTDQLRPPGTTLRLIVSATFGPAKAEGVVRWMHTTAGEMGMGIEFTQLSLELLEYLETRLGGNVCVNDPAQTSLHR